MYAGSNALLVDLPAGAAPDDADRSVRAAIDAQPELTAEHPRVVVVPGAGVFAGHTTEALAKVARDVYVDAIRVSVGATRFGGARPLTQRERAFIETWEAEAYRKSVASGRIVLVSRCFTPPTACSTIRVIDTTVWPRRRADRRGTRLSGLSGRRRRR